MPTVSLRLTEEELAQLHAWAHDSRRSVQKEIIWRLFSMAQIPLKSGAGPMIPAALETSNAAAGVPRAVDLQADDHFRPDFGSKLGTP